MYMHEYIKYLFVCKPEPNILLDEYTEMDFDTEAPVVTSEATSDCNDF